MIDWFAYAECTKEKFIERLAHLDPLEHPDNAIEIAEAQRLQRECNVHPDYADAIDDMMRQYIIDNPDSQYGRELLERLFPVTPVPDNFGIKAEDVRARIEELRRATNEGAK